MVSFVDSRGAAYDQSAAQSTRVDFCL